jgi:hypothetical protein
VARLTVDATLLVQKILGVEPFPLVTAMFPTMWDPDEQRRVEKALREEMRTVGILGPSDAPHPQLAAWIADLCAPDRQMTVLARTGETVLRAAVVRRGNSHVTMMRCGEEVVISGLAVASGSDGVRELIEVLTQILGQAPPLARDVAPVTGPAEELTADHMQTLTRWGASAEDAHFWLDLADEQPSRLVEVEIAQFGGSRVATPGENTIRIIDTSQGRCMIAPSATDYGRWATFSQADPPAIRRALVDLIQLLPARSWSE